MRIIALVIFTVLFTALRDKSIENVASKENEANKILQKVLDKLTSCKNIRYKLKRESDYPSENYHNETSWNVYFDFESTDTLLGFKYQIEDKTLKQFFNGMEKFELDKKEKTLALDEQPNRSSMKDLSAFYNSIITLKNIIPAIIESKTIERKVSDTTINNNSYDLITLFTNKKRIDNLGKRFDAMSTKYNFIYKLIIDKKDNFPIAVLQQNDENKDCIKTTFTDIQTNTSAPAESTWYYSTYAPAYKSAIKKELHLLPVGSTAPGWALPLYNQEETVKLQKLKGKVILLDFWIKNCGPCIQSIPHLNALEKKFSNKKFEILGVNSYDPKKDIELFCNKHKPNYRILMQGKAVAEKYGVSGFPFIVLVSKEGKVLYAGGFEKPAIEQLIKKAL